MSHTRGFPAGPDEGNNPPRRPHRARFERALAAIMAPCVLGSSAWGRAPVAERPLSRADTGALWDLFVQSFDLFTVVLVTMSVVSVAVIIAALIELRAARMLPPATINRLEDLSAAGRWDDVRDLSNRDGTLVSRVVAAAVSQMGRGPDAVRDAAEFAAAEESAAYFRRVEILNIVGNVGPLVGLAGTVWGMILAFTSLGESAGRAGPTDLSLGISKALFHTLLGLCVAIPSLLAFGYFRARVDRLCTRASVIASRIVDRIPARNAP
jgi:biopolymer transport protein ExbB